MNETESAYGSLKKVLDAAYDQAAHGKGKERHARQAEPFEKQKICEIARRVGTGYCTGQAIKKTMESHRLPYPRNLAEIYGAINYLAGAAIVMEEEASETKTAQEVGEQAFLQGSDDIPLGYKGSCIADGGQAEFGDI